MPSLVYLNCFNITQVAHIIKWFRVFYVVGQNFTQILLSASSNNLAGRLLLLITDKSIFNYTARL